MKHTHIIMSFLYTRWLLFNTQSKGAVSPLLFSSYHMASWAEHCKRRGCQQSLVLKKVSVVLEGSSSQWPHGQSSYD